MCWAWIWPVLLLALVRPGLTLCALLVTCWLLRRPCECEKGVREGKNKGEKREREEGEEEQEKAGEDKREREKREKEEKEEREREGEARLA